MENTQGSLGANITHTESSDCKSIVIADGNTYTGALATEAKKLFYVRQETNGDFVMFESEEADHEATSFTVPKAKFKDGWNYAFLLAVPKTIEGNLLSEYEKGDLIWYETLDSSFKGFFIAAKNMGATGECPVEAPNNTTGTCGCSGTINAGWRKPSFLDFYGYIDKKKTGCDCASDIEYGYGEALVTCKSKILRNELYIDAGCPCKCNYKEPLTNPTTADLYLESILIHKQNKNYQKAQEIIEELEKMNSLL